MNHLKYWIGVWIIGLSMIFFLGTGICGTYIYYNEDGEVVRYLPSKKVKKGGETTKQAKIYKGRPAGKPYAPKSKTKEITGPIKK